MTRWIVLGVFVCVSMASAQNEVTWDKNGHAYELVKVKRGISWPEAREEAERRGGYLACITSSAENQFVRKLLRDEDLKVSNGPWLGGFQPDGSPEPDGNWQWVSKEPWNFDDWDNEQPNNYKAGECYLQYMNKGWNDQGAKNKLPAYVVEYESLPQPESKRNASPQFRIWTDTQGQRLEATLVDEKDGKVILQTRAKKTTTLPIEKLSREDREYLGHTEKTSPEPEAAKPSSYENQLKKLKALHEQGLISKSVFEKKQEALLDTLLNENGSASAVPVEKTYPVDLKRGLVLDLGFDAEGLAAEDRSGHENHGIVKGATWVPNGRIGGAYLFRQQDKNDQIVITDSDSLDVDAITVCAWVKTENEESGWARIFDKHWEKGFCLTMGGTSESQGSALHGRVKFEPGRKRAVVPKKKISDGKWHSLIASYEKGKLKFYLDGQISAKRSYPRKLSPVPKNDRDLVIGNATPGYIEHDSQSNAFDGLIDEVRIYNRVLSPEEVEALYTLAK